LSGFMNGFISECGIYIIYIYIYILYIIYNHKSN
jgi:hypothetical protein